MISSPKPADVRTVAARTQVTVCALTDVACFLLQNLYITEAGIPNLLSEIMWGKMSILDV